MPPSRPEENVSTKASATPRVDASAASSTTATAPQQAHRQLLSRLWEQNLPVMRERVASLQRAAELALSGNLSPTAHTEASDLAHKLAGSLGMFGYPQGTELAREIEHLLEGSDPPQADRLRRLTADLRSILPL